MTILRTEATALEAPKQLAVKQWLEHAGAIHAETHVRGLIADHLCNASNSALRSKDKPLMVDDANSHVLKAQRLETFLEVLSELQKETRFTSRKVITDKE